MKRLAVAIGIMLFGCVVYLYPQLSGLTSPDAFTLWQSIGSGIVGIGFIKATTAGLNTGKSAEEKRHEEILRRLDQINARISSLEKPSDSSGASYDFDTLVR